MLAARTGKGAAPRGGASSRARRGPAVAARALPPGPRANSPARPGRGRARGTAGRRRLGAGRAATLSCPSLARPLPAGRRSVRSPWRGGRAAARTRGRDGVGRSPGAEAEADSRYGMLRQPDLASKRWRSGSPQPKVILKQRWA